MKLIIKKITTLIHTVLVFVLVSSPLSELQAETKTTFYIPDALGSPIAAMDEVGNVIWRKHYKPYGEELEQIAEQEAAKENSTNWTYMDAP